MGRTTPVHATDGLLSSQAARTIHTRKNTRCGTIQLANPRDADPEWPELKFQRTEATLCHILKPVNFSL